MKLLLDTHIFLWWNSGDARLPTSMRTEIDASQNTVWVSAASAWEIGIKRKIGKLTLNGSVDDAIRRHHFASLSISVLHAEQAGDLPLLHSDPFDRLLIAQAHTEGMVLATVDAQILRYPIAHL